MKKQINYLFISILLLTLVSCDESNNSGTSEIAQSYEILRIEPFESNSKAQINVYAYLTEDFISKESLEATAKKIKSQTIKAGNFKKHNKATAYMLFIYPGKKMAEIQGTWLVRYSMGPLDNKYEFDFNEDAIRGHDKVSTKPKTESDIAFEEINERLETVKSTTACELYFHIAEYEARNIQIANSRFPDRGQRHTDLISELDNIEKNKLLKEYNLTASDFTILVWEGTNKCK